MSELILKYKASLLTIVGYSGVCHTCDSPITYSGEITGVKFEDTEDSFRLLFLDALYCPHCDTKMIYAKVYKNLEVTKEFRDFKYKDLVK